MTFTTITSREGRAHAVRFVSHLARSAVDYTGELRRLSERFARDEHRDARRLGVELFARLVSAAELDAEEGRSLVALLYLRLQYLLEVQGFGPELEGLLASGDLLDARYLVAIEAIETDLLRAIAAHARRVVRSEEMNREMERALGFLGDYDRAPVIFEEEATLPVEAAPPELTHAGSSILALALPILAGLWPNKTNTPGPKSPADIPKK